MVDYESFEDTAKSLGISDAELKQLVSEGTLRAFRDDGKVKFRREDVEALKRSNLGAGSAPILTPTEAGRGLRADETDETLVDLDSIDKDLDFEDTGETSVPTVDLTGGDDDDATLTDELVFNESDDVDLLDADATVAMDDSLTLDDDLGLETEPLSALNDADATVLDDGNDLNLDGDELSLDPSGGGGYQQGGFMPPPMMAAPQIQIQERVQYVEIVSNEKIWVTIVGVLVMVFMLTAFFASSTALGGPVFQSLNNLGFKVGKGNMGTNGALSTIETPAPLTTDGKIEEPGTNPDLKKYGVSASTNESDVLYPAQSLYRDTDGNGILNEGEAQAKRVKFEDGKKITR